MTINNNQHSSDMTATAPNHGRKHSSSPRPEAQTTAMTAMTVESVENARTIGRRTSVDEKPKSRRRTASRNARSNHDPPKATCVDSVAMKMLTSSETVRSRVLCCDELLYSVYFYCAIKTIVHIEGGSGSDRLTRHDG